jgi:ribosome assembly protein RRB1
MSSSKKRSAESGQGRKEDVDSEPNIEELEFEDPYGDDIEEEEEEEKYDEVEGEGGEAEGTTEAAPGAPQQVIKQVWRAGVEKLEDIEDLEYDPSAYIMYHSMQTEWPCLSFDFLKDDLGDNRHRVSASQLWFFDNSFF